MTSPIAHPPLRITGPLLFFLALSFVFCLQVLTRNQIYLFRDMYSILLPLEQIIKDMIAEGHLPIWNPYQVLGKPLAGEPLAGIFYPPNWLLFFVSQPLSYNLSLIFHHTFAALGAYLLGRVHGCSVVSSLFCGVIYSFGGMVVSLDNMLNALQSATWLPWTLVYASHLLRHGRASSFVAMSVFAGLTFLGGMPEVLFIEAAILSLMLLTSDLSGERKRAVIFTKFLIAGVSGLLLSAIALFPFIEYVLYSERAQGLSLESALRFSVNPLNLFGLLIPRQLLSKEGVFSASSSLISGYYPETPWALSYYISFAALLALAGLYFAHKSGQKWIWLSAAILCLISLGENLPGYKKALELAPILASVRYPEKWLIGTHLCLALASAMTLSVIGQKVRLSLAPVILLAAVYADLYRVNGSLAPAAEWAPSFRSPDIVEIIKRGPLPRIYSSKTINDSNYTVEVNLKDNLEILDEVLAGVFGISNVNTPSSINLSDHSLLIKMISGSSKGQIINIFRGLGVDFVTRDAPLNSYPNLTLLRSSEAEKWYIYSISDSAPRFSFAKNVITADSQVAAFENLRSDHSASTAALEGVSFPEVSGEGNVSLQNYTPTRVELSVTTESDQLLVLRDTYYPGWKAYLDHKEAEIFRVNGCMRGVHIPPGNYNLTFIYRPLSLQSGAFFTVLTIFILLAMSLWLRSRSKSEFGMV